MHPRTLQPVLDQMPTCSLDHSTANWVTGCQVFVVLHSIPVPLEIVCGVADGFPLLSLQTILGRLVPQTSDHVFRVCRVRLTTCVRAALVVTSIDPLSDALA